MKLGRMLSIPAALGYLVPSLLIWGAKGAVLAALVTVFPMGCIWFSKEIGDYIGMSHFRCVNRRSPAGMVEAFGWCLLLAPLIAALARSVL